MAHQPKGQIVRYQKGKHKFEVLCKPGLPLQFRENKIGWDKVLMIDMVFTNSSKGDRAGGAELTEIFGTDNMDECCKKIVMEGDIQLTQQERDKFYEEARKQIVFFIHKNYIDPKTKLPHPPDRIDHAMTEIKFKIDPNKDAKSQAEDCATKLQGKLMLSKAVQIQARLTIKKQHVGQCKNIIHKIANVTHEEWVPEGCIFDLELTKPDLDQLTSALYKPTSGDYHFQFVDEASFANIDQPDTSKPKKGKKHAQSKSAKNEDSDNNEQEEKTNENINTNKHEHENQNKKDKKKKKEK